MLDLAQYFPDIFRFDVNGINFLDHKEANAQDDSKRQAVAAI